MTWQTARVGAACDALAATIEREIGAISVLVNNAGIIRRGKVDDPDARTDWDATLAVNLDGPYNMTTAFLVHLRASRGAVINIGSIQSFVALPNSAAYTTSKGGIRALTKALDRLQALLDVAGLLPLLGAAPDVLNGGISAARGGRRCAIVGH